MGMFPFASPTSIKNIPSLALKQMMMEYVVVQPVQLKALLKTKL